MFRRVLSLLMMLVVTLATVLPADAARVRVVKRGPHKRTVVTIRTGHPIHRPMRAVVVRRPGVVTTVAAVSFLPLVVWAPVVVARPERDALVWEDAETISRDEDWTETLFQADARGEKLFLEVVSGRVQFDFAEVVFANGDCQVVDFANGTRSSGVYALLDFRDGRKVDHVRLIARARSDEARIALLMRR